jgi:hypothetical protein
MVLTLAQILTLLTTGQQLVGIGVATVEQIRSFIKGLGTSMTDAELNALLDVIATGAAAHKKLADLDLGKS